MKTHQLATPPNQPKRTRARHIRKTVTAAVATIAIVSLFSLACRAPASVLLGPPHRLPEPSQIVLPVPSSVVSASDTVTDVSMQNVLLHIDDDAMLGVHHLRGRAQDLRGQHTLMLDDKTTLQFDIADAEIALSPRSLSIVLNRYIFGFKGSPLKDLVVRVEGDHIVQTGTMHKIIDIPFEMTAALSVSADGWIRIHPTKIRICSLDGQKLLEAVGSSLEDLLDLSAGKGVRVKGNDLFIDPLISLPPPRIRGRLSEIRVANGEVVQTFGSPGDGGPAISPPVAAANFIYFQGGSVKLGKLYMVKTDLEVIDADPADAFEFYLDYYNTQLVAGYHISTADFGLVAYMPDFDDVGTVKGRVVRSAAASAPVAHVAPVRPAH